VGSTSAPRFPVSLPAAHRGMRRGWRVPIEHLRKETGGTRRAPARRLVAIRSALRNAASFRPCGHQPAGALKVRHTRSRSPIDSRHGLDQSHQSTGSYPKSGAHSSGARRCRRAFRTAPRDGGRSRNGIAPDAAFRRRRRRSPSATAGAGTRRRPSAGRDDG
jgi:hypothetical protein